MYYPSHNYRNTCWQDIGGVAKQQTNEIGKDMLSNHPWSHLAIVDGENRRAGCTRSVDFLHGSWERGDVMPTEDVFRARKVHM